MNAQSLLSQYGITMDQAADWVIANISNPTQIFEVCRQVGISNSMLTEIIDYRFPNITVDQVKGYFSANSLDPSVLDAVNTTVSPSVGAAAANELFDGILHWQRDHNMYSLDSIDSALAGFTEGGTHFSYLDLISFDLNPNSTSGYLTVSVYHEHTWKLSLQETSDWANTLINSDFLTAVEHYQDTQDLQGYINYCNGMISQYDALVASAPNYSSHWIL